jgi:hypothetical protein
MPIETVPGTAITYHLIAYDAQGCERQDDPAGLMSQKAVAAVKGGAATDVFLLSHGWRGDLPAARAQDGRWTGAMAASPADVALMQQKRPGFRPLLIGLHWPSEPWSDDAFAGSESFATTGADPVEQHVDEVAAKTVDTPAARAALRTIVSAALDDNDPPSLPPEVRAAYAALDREIGLGAGGEASPPGDDREPFDAQAIYRSASHGAVLPNGHPDQERHQGALVCQDWPGPVAWRKPFPNTFYVSRDDIADAADVKGMIAFFFACYGAGTPQLDDFGHKEGVRQPLAPNDLVAALPRRLLGLPGGGALAVVGHIDRAWSYSFQWGRAGDHLDNYQWALTQLLAGVPVGAAVEVFNMYYASIAVLLNGELQEIKFGKVADDVELSGLWTAHNDARNLVILGDPAVRLASA